MSMSVDTDLCNLLHVETADHARDGRVGEFSIHCDRCWSTQMCPSLSLSTSPGEQEICADPGRPGAGHGSTQPLTAAPTFFCYWDLSRTNGLHHKKQRAEMSPEKSKQRLIKSDCHSRVSSSLGRDASSIQTRPVVDEQNILSGGRFFEVVPRKFSLKEFLTFTYRIH